MDPPSLKNGSSWKGSSLLPQEYGSFLAPARMGAQVGAPPRLPTRQSSSFPIPLIAFKFEANSQGRAPPDLLTSRHGGEEEVGSVWDPWSCFSPNSAVVMIILDTSLPPTQPPPTCMSTRRGKSEAYHACPSLQPGDSRQVLVSPRIILHKRFLRWEGSLGESARSSQGA